MGEDKQIFGKIDERKKIFDFLLGEEWLRLKPYRCTAGALTIGVGRNLDAKGISVTESFMLLLNDIEEHERFLEEHVPGYRAMTVKRKCALNSMVHALGRRGFLNFTCMRAALEAGDWPRAALELRDSKWYRTPELTARVDRLARMIKEG